MSKSLMLFMAVLLSSGPVFSQESYDPGDSAEPEESIWLDDKELDAVETGEETDEHDDRAC